MNIHQKHTQKISRGDLEKVLSVSRGEEPADWLFENLQILNVITGEVQTTALVLCGSTIAGFGDEYMGSPAHRTLNAHGLTAVPGFIDSHLHIESSLMNPFEFEAMTLPLGTTTVICDPHEITNVMGGQGFKWFLRCSEELMQNMFIQTPSCVPALPGVETNGADFKIEEMLQTKDHPHVLGLAEMMNFPGVIQGDPMVLDKLENFADLHRDGHCPLLTGKGLNAYIAAGIQNCHETVSLNEAKEKISRGMALMLREGSVAKNLRDLAPIITEFNSIQCLLCTDDRNPYEISHEGHLNFLIRTLIKDCQVQPHIAYRMASYSAARHFGLKRLGLIAPGYQADFVLLKDIANVSIEEVFVKGRPQKEFKLNEKLSEKFKKSRPPIENTIKRMPLKEDQILQKLKPKNYPVIVLIPDQIITDKKEVFFDGEKFAEVDVLKMWNIERYGFENPIGKGFLKGMGLKRGAIATTVAHDSHNLLVVGTTEAEMILAANTLIKCGGGFCVVEGEQVLALLELPLAGLMSLESGDAISQKIAKLKSASRHIGCQLKEPFLQLAFLALPVIPTLKLTDKGLYEVGVGAIHF